MRLSGSAGIRGGVGVGRRGVSVSFGAGPLSVSGNISGLVGSLVSAAPALVFFFGVVLLLLAIVSGVAFGVWLLILLWLIAGPTVLAWGLSARQARRAVVDRTRAELSSLKARHTVSVPRQRLAIGMFLFVLWAISMVLLQRSDGGIPERPRIFETSNQTVSLFWTQESETVFEVWWMAIAAGVSSLLIAILARRTAWDDATVTVIDALVSKYPGIKKARRAKLRDALWRSTILSWEWHNDVVRRGNTLRYQRLLYFLALAACLTPTCVFLAGWNHHSSDSNSLVGVANAASTWQDGAVILIPAVFGLILVKDFLVGMLFRANWDAEMRFLFLGALSGVSLVSLLFLFLDSMSDTQSNQAFALFTLVCMAISHLLQSSTAALGAKHLYLNLISDTVAALRKERIETTGV